MFGFRENGGWALRRDTRLRSSRMDVCKRKDGRGLKGELTKPVKWVLGLD